jgi:SAM-dependent methyltransferase
MAASQAPASDTEAPACPLCGGSDYRLLMDRVRDRLYGKPGVFQLQRCGGCGLVATRPRPTARRLSLYYQDAYSGKAQGRVSQWQTGWMGRWVARARLRAIGRTAVLTAESHVLDVGCGYGEFLRLARTATRCQVFGIDMDPALAAQAARHAGARCVVGDLVRHEWGGQRFDMLTFFQSLEHLADPLAALQRAHALLRPGGVCVVELPDFESIWRHLFGRFWMPLVVPQHLYHFDPRSLARAFEQAGFIELKHRSMWYPLESTTSLGLCLHALAKRLQPGFKLSWRRPGGWLIGLVLILWWPLVELPSQCLLWAIGRTGNQMMLARRP